MIQFTPDRWSHIRETAELWWSGELKRPLLQITLTGADPERDEPELHPVSRTACYDFAVPADKIVDRWDYDLSRTRYLGDSFPARHPDFGPGVIAAFIGAETVVDTNTVWFKYEEDTPPDRFDFRSDLRQPWVKRIETVYTAALDRWQGAVQLGATDLGGSMDILSTFRPNTKLPLDLYDAPGDVQDVVWALHAIWWTYYEHFNEILQPTNPGYTSWTPMFSSDPFYMLQCDFCYMIGPEMFDEFVLPELEASCMHLDNAFYHLDGPGQLPHLDSLLEIETLKGIQWVPGAGSPEAANWPEVYRKIRDAGKCAQVVGDMAQFDAVAEQLGSAEGLCLIASVPITHANEAIEFLEKYGAPTRF